MVKSKKEDLKFLKLNPVKLGLACGITTAICVLFIGLMSLKGYFPIANFILQDMYGGFLFGTYGVSNVLLTAIYSGVDFFILTGLFALIYNKLLKR